MTTFFLCTLHSLLSSLSAALRQSIPKPDRITATVWKLQSYSVHFVAQIDLILVKLASIVSKILYLPFFGSQFKVTLTFDFLTPKSNPHTYNPKNICVQNWVKFPLLLFEIWCLLVQTHKLTYGRTLPNTKCLRYGTAGFLRRTHKMDVLRHILDSL